MTDPARQSDAIVVGSGPSGAVVANELAHAGIGVTVFEQGDWIPAEAFDGARPQWELTQLRQWHPNPNIRDRREDYPIDVTHSDINPLMFAGVGGAALIYGAHWMRFMPSDFRVRTLDGVADDWPSPMPISLRFMPMSKRQWAFRGRMAIRPIRTARRHPCPRCPSARSGARRR